MKPKHKEHEENCTKAHRIQTSKHAKEAVLTAARETERNKEKCDNIFLVTDNTDRKTV